MKSVRIVTKIDFWERGSWAANAALPYRLHGIASSFGVDIAVVLNVLEDENMCEVRKKDGYLYILDNELNCLGSERKELL